ncbi:hypothetical protein SUGI_0226640 [Cryptomeria japonica]|uniref:octanoyltransferase LIP2p, chloroplastic n=1 Tax=Cryptomeria japonica TaxID=3369 RepID=UPI002408CF7A|nr:octanoyltransferase LIP2p, chloroplastic [Cryptomeria japonica]GLJ14124.1 hypothetical protein SUGI_0226640 [Cryptomeria japonica]
MAANPTPSSSTSALIKSNGYYGSKSFEYGSVKHTLIRCSPSIYSWKWKAKLCGFVSSKQQVFAQATYKCDYYNLSTELIPYKDALSWQKCLVEAKQALLKEDEDVCSSLVVLQHPPVYTLGTRSSEKYLHFDLQHSPIDIFRTDRGGEVTYHGPGQLVMYPIMNLRHYKMDLHWYLRALEEVIIRALWSEFSLKGSRIDGLTGVWIGNQKVAAIGIHVSRWITYHGLAINVTTDLKPFSKIIPCGISDRAVGSLFEILNSSQDVAIPRLKGSSQKLDASTLLDLTLNSLLKEFSEVFQVDLIEKTALDVRSISEFANA